ncbi:MAG: hypothetical protein GXX96_17275 [Planctomycetaceae bacterium]|nr:hypothetical protein [Planctomycetaceae bacterium]
MNIRQFRDSGIEAFRSFLAECRSTPNKPVPAELLEDDAHTLRIEPPIAVGSKHFVERGDAAEYLRETLSPLPDHEVAGNAGLWTWLTLFFFDQVCPDYGAGRIVKNDYHYIFEPKNPRHFYRHLLYIAWKVRVASPVHNRLFLRTPLSSLDKVTTEVTKRLYLTRIPCIYEVLDRLYWDDNRGRPKVGIVSPKTVPGDLARRLPSRIRQLEKTYDLYSLNADQMIELLGDEFQSG